MANSCKPFYVNVILRNKEEVVANAVAERTGISPYGIMGHLAGFAANQLVTDDSVIEDLSDQLIEGVHKAVSEIGIKATFRKRYQYGSYVVIRVQVTEVDKLALILASKGADFAHYFSTLLVAAAQMGIDGTVNAQIDDKVRLGIDEGMKKKIGELIPLTLEEKGIDVDCVCCFSEDQVSEKSDCCSTLINCMMHRTMLTVPLAVQIRRTSSST